MKAHRFQIAAITALALLDLRPTEEEAVRELLTAASRSVDVLVLGETPREVPAGVRRQAGDPVEALRAFQLARGQAPEQTLVIGCHRSDLRLAEHCALYFHVGAEAELERRSRRLVPLWGQYGAGVANVLEYFGERGFRDAVVEHGDVVDFVGRSIGFYDSPSATSTARQEHRAFCEELSTALGDEVAGIFGTGFPFYCPEPSLGEAGPRTPASILDYLREQEAYFDSKLLGEAAYRRHRDSVFDAGSAEAQLGLALGRNQFDLYEYESAGVPPPPTPASGPLRDLLAETAFSICEDPWPCMHCVTLQSPDLQPRQRVAKDTNETCLRCRQTSLMLRNVTGSAFDLDAVIVVHGDAPAAAERVKGYVREAGRHYLYDHDLLRMIEGEGAGLLDLFVTTKADLLAALEELGGSRWLGAGFPTVALWSLTLLGHWFNLGEDFVVGFEPQAPLDPGLEQALRQARQAFAEAHADEQVVEELRAHSFARRQLLGNPEVVELIERRLARWRQLEAG